MLQREIFGRLDLLPVKVRVRRPVVFRLATLSILFLCLSPGCGDSGPSTVPVTGVVLTEDGQVCDGALVVFHPRDPGLENTAKPVATTDGEGKFVLTTYSQGDGAVPGDYGVTIVWNKATGGGKLSLSDEGGGAGGPDQLKNRYGDPREPKLFATVKPDEDNSLKFEVAK